MLSVGLSRLTLRAREAILCLWVCFGGGPPKKKPSLKRTPAVLKRGTVEDGIQFSVEEYRLQGTSLSSSDATTQPFVTLPGSLVRGRKLFAPRRGICVPWRNRFAVINAPRHQADALREGKTLSCVTRRIIFVTRRWQEVIRRWQEVIRRRREVTRRMSFAMVPA